MPETIPPRQRTLDVRKATHPRNALFKAAELRPDWFAKPPRDRVWTPGAQLDQGNEGACVGFGSWGEALATPARVRPAADPNQQAFTMYHEARKRDEWEGEDYDGTSLTGGGNAMKALGYLDGFLWLHSAEEIAHAIAWSGPVVMGLPWTTTMDDGPDGEGFFQFGGSIRGWHCVLLYGSRGWVPGSSFVARPHFRMRNSWGGHANGFFDKPTIDNFFREGGDAWVAQGRHAQGRLGLGTGQTAPGAGQPVSGR